MSELQPARLLTFPNQHEAKLTARMRELVTADPRSQRLARQLEKLARTEAAVLIVGETGTGKELAARYLHEHSARTGPFLAVNCGALSEHLVEAELFGHEAGAFTGAQQARAGWFEAAHGGTLFLDEIGDMPLHLQVRLLRVLQERQVVRVGSRKPIPVNVRVVAATNVELGAAVGAGRFRRDLYYRLNVAPVHLPALRERPGDILTLARQFIEVYRREAGLGEARLSADAERALLAHSWPGNIRELENAVHYALIMCSDGVLRASDFPVESGFVNGSPEHAAAETRGSPASAPVANASVGRAPVASAPVASASPASGSGTKKGDATNDDPLEGVRDELRHLLASGQEGLHAVIERLLITTAFEHCDRNQVHTARRLGLSRNVVRAQLMRHGLLTGTRRAFPARSHETEARAGR
jgi:sigma-54-specific transcriptional regulator